MSRLTVLEGLPAAHRLRVGPHAYRRLGRRVLITNDWGGRAFLSEEEYRRFLGGLGEGDPLWSALQAQGFVKNALDFDAAAGETASRGLPAWKGPATHLLFLERGGKTMSLDTARRCLDFAFSVPGPALTVELAARRAEQVWPALWFCVQYARRREEWSRRRLFLTARLEEPLAGERLDFLRGHGVAWRRVLKVSGPAGAAAAPGPGARRALCVVGKGAKNPAGWADRFAGSSLDSLRLAPARALLTPPGVKFFLAFYGRFLDRLIERSEEPGPAEETALAFLGRNPWSLSGADILEELAYSVDGGVHTSAEGLALAEGGTSAFRLGRAGELRYQDLAASQAARACVAASQADNQPLCSQCAYKPFCALPPALNFALQGTVWGDLVSSPLCALHMGLLDILFSRIEDEKTQRLLRRWGL